jgi:hypothetical protein
MNFNDVSKVGIQACGISDNKECTSFWIVELLVANK